MGVFKGFFNPKCRTSSGSLLLKTDLQTAYRLLHHKGCGLHIFLLPVVSLQAATAPRLVLHVPQSQ